MSIIRLLSRLLTARLAMWFNLGIILVMLRSGSTLCAQSQPSKKSTRQREVGSNFVLGTKGLGRTSEDLDEDAAHSPHVNLSVEKTSEVHENRLFFFAMLVNRRTFTERQTK